MLDGEGHARVVGAVRTADGWRLHVWQAEGDDDWLALDVRLSLRDHGVVARRPSVEGQAGRATTP